MYFCTVKALFEKSKTEKSDEICKLANRNPTERNINVNYSTSAHNLVSSSFEIEYRIIRGLDEERVKFSGGIINGDYLRYRDGVLRESGIYAKGKRNGIFTEYYQDGVTPRKETPMQQGKIDGTVKTYFRNGKIETEKEYRQSVESGRERRFDSKTGEQIFESHYIDGKKEGEEWEIFEDGRTLRSRTTRHYRNGKLDGSYRVESTRDGKPYITIEGQYTDGEKSGHWKQYNATDDTTHEWDE